jgi:hypothetical protein
VRFRVCFLYSLICNYCMDNLRPGGALRWKAEDRWVGPHLCQLRTDGLAPAIKYWTYWWHTGDMCPINWCSLFVNECLAFSTASMVVRGRETRWGPTDWSADVLGCSREFLFLESSDFVQWYGWLTKGYHVRGLLAGSVQVAYVHWREKRTCHVYQVSPTGYTSIWITVTLGYE